MDEEQGLASPLAGGIRAVRSTVSSSIFSMLRGVQILRIHDVNEVNQGIKVFKKLNFN